MPYVKNLDRNQMMVTSWDTLVEKESIARIIDAFINSLCRNWAKKKKPEKVDRLMNPADYSSCISTAIETEFVVFTFL